MTATSPPSLGEPDHVGGLEGCRGIAVATVVVLHSFGAAGVEAWGGARAAAPFVLGWSGLAVFFTLSGFLLHRQLLVRPIRDAGDAGRFWARRVARIHPGWWLLLAVGWGWPGTGNPFALDRWREWLLVGGPGERTQALGHAWSLEAEVGFYLVLPLLAALGARLGRGAVGHLTVAAGFFAASATATAWLAGHEHRYWVSRTALGVGTHFAVGMALAVAVVRWPRERPPAVVRWVLEHPWAPAAGAAAVVGALLALPRPREVIDEVAPALEWRVGLALAAGAALVPVLWGRPGSRTQRWLASRPLQHLGVRSYGIYLWHHPIVHWVSGIEATLPTSPATVRVQGAFGLPDPVTILAATTVLSLVAAEVSWRLVEAPARAWVRRRIGQPAPLVVSVPLPADAR